MAYDYEKDFLRLLPDTTFVVNQQAGGGHYAIMRVVLPGAHSGPASGICAGRRPGSESDVGQERIPWWIQAQNGGMMTTSAYIAGRWFGAIYLADLQNADGSTLSKAAMAILNTPEERAEIAAAARAEIGVAADALTLMRFPNGRVLFDMPRFIAGVKTGIVKE